VSISERAVSGARPDPGELARHYKRVCSGLRDGTLTPFLGAGASLYGRPPDGKDWKGAPTAEELAQTLISEFELHGEPPDLMRVAQYAYVDGGWGDLYRALHQRFASVFPPTELHTFLADALARVAEKCGGYKSPLIVTTNYDSLIESALAQRGIAFDLLYYSADGEHRGWFCHRLDDGSNAPIRNPDLYIDVDPEARPVVLKMHGFVDTGHTDADRDSFVITEDHYIDYLASTTALEQKLPPHIVRRLERSHLLVLGYSLRDWNMRAILRLLRTDWDQAQWWAVLLNPDPLDVKSWERRNVTFYDMTLEEYVAGLREFFERWLEST
jgi:SIR2-like domain